MSKLCLPVGLSAADMQQLESIIETSMPYREGESVFEIGDNFRRLYAVKSGMFKTYLIDSQGNEHIIGFHLSGELFGLDAIYPKKYSSTAVSLGTSMVCAIDFEQLEGLAIKLPSLQRQLLSLMSKEVRCSQNMAADLPAGQKLAKFLLGLSRRYRERGYSESRFSLLMPRRDIANHLSMAPETVSRIFKRLQSEQIISVTRNDISLNNLALLKELALCGDEGEVLSTSK